MTKWTKKYGFIGMGNMGYAILKGLLGQNKPETITFAEKSRQRCLEIQTSTGVAAEKDNRALASDAKYLILAVKPQQFDGVIEEIRDVVTEEQILISIAPGISSGQIREKLGKNCRIVRAMPNTPALVGEGMTGICYDTSLFTKEETDTVWSFFEAFGKVELVDEKLINAVVCASGSSPAYVYLFIEALADSAVKFGMPRDQAYRMTAQTVLGSAKMVLETGDHPGRLKDQVCSPGGTTIAAVAALEEYGFRNAVIKANNACYEKCSNLK